MGVRLRRFPEYLASMRSLLERADGLEKESHQDEDSDMTGVEMLPRQYREAHGDVLDAAYEIQDLVQQGWQARVGFSAHDKNRSFLNLRKRVREVAAKRTRIFKSINRFGVFPPYLTSANDGALSDYEQSREHDLRGDILEELCTVSDTTLQKICEMRTAGEECLVIAENIKLILSAYGRSDASVAFSVGEKGVQVHVHHKVKNHRGEQDGDGTVLHEYILTRSRYAGFVETPRAKERDFDDATVLLTDPIKKR
jgi:hypothetical protein